MNTKILIYPKSLFDRDDISKELRNLPTPQKWKVEEDRTHFHLVLRNILGDRK